VVLNALALLLGLGAAPFLAEPAMRLAFVAFVANVLFGAVAVLLLLTFGLAGPIGGVVGALRGKTTLPVVTATLWALTFVGVLLLATATGLHPFVEAGREQGDPPPDCQPIVQDVAVLERPCTTDGGLASQGDCPDGLACMTPVQGRPQLTCRALCWNDCQCPRGSVCVYGFCARR
jgi:hypothetical protein